MADRPYSSKLREDQAQRTRDLILAALTELLSERSAHEITTREIAERAGVSQPTVYRHFPDRQALLEGLSNRVTLVMPVENPATASIDDIPRRAAEYFAATERHAIEATADAILNADPRRLSQPSRYATAELRRAVEDAFSDFGADEHNQVTALLRCILTVQTWLRMREEFGMSGAESGPVVEWALETLIKEIRAGTFPRHP